MLPLVAALRSEVRRTTDLLRSIRDPQAPALGVWTVAELAAHLSHAWRALPALAGASHGLIGELDDLAGMTTRMVTADPERDLGVLADRIDAAAAAFVESLAADPGEPCPWMVEGVTVDRRHIACHLLSETVVHARDLARADRRRWRVDRASAVLIVRGFLFPTARALASRALLDQDRAAGVRASFDVHVSGGPPIRLVVDGGRLLVPDRGTGRPDCHIAAEPTALLLLLWGREPLWHTIATGRMITWGARPWLGPQLTRMLRHP